MKKFKFYSDPGHGWVAVKRQLLSELGILDKITNFSYEKGKTVYLEEDYDAGLFAEAWLAKHGRYPIYEGRLFDNDCRIRRYNYFEVCDHERTE